MFYIKQELPINGQIRAKEVQLISDNGEKLGMVPLARALEIAGEKKLDLVLVSPNSQVPVCKIMNYGKYKFEQAKKEKESRKLIVYEQEATVSTQLTDSLIKKLDLDWLKKTQKVSYTGKGYFVVDLDKLTKKDVMEDRSQKQITIKIDHAYLEAIKINPEDIIIDEVKESFLAKGDIKLSVEDYNIIERELKTKLEAKFNCAENGQKADDIALKMVKEVYEPIIQAVDRRYHVIVEFQSS